MREEIRDLSNINIRRAIANPENYFKDGLEIMEKVTQYFWIGECAFFNAGRNKFNIFCKHMCVLLICELNQYTLNEIAWLLSLKDHSSVIHARDRMRENVEIIPLYKNTYKELKSLL